MSAPRPAVHLLPLPRLTELLAEVVLLEPAAVHPHDRLVDDLGVQSIDIVELAERIEADLGTDLSHLDLGPVETVSELHAALIAVLADPPSA